MSGLADVLRHVVAEVVVIPPESLPEAIREMANPAVIACVFVVSREAMMDTTFTNAVRASLNELGTRRDFRLFVHLSGMTRQDLIASTEAVPAAADLLDSVHIGESAEEGELDRLVENIETHLRRLPEILDSMRYDRWKSAGGRLAPLLTVGFVTAYSFSAWMLTSRPKEILTSDWLPWILATIGAVFYTSFLAISSFGSSVRGGTLLRWAMAVYPLWIINSIPSPKLVEHWPFLLTGFGAGIVLDATRRMWAMMRRRFIPIALPNDESDSPNVAAAGTRGWQTLTTAPVLGIEPHVFISYSRASAWGSDTAASLHEAINAAGIPSFLDADGIAEGTSWRHKLQDALGKATVFIAVQDAVTASRHWPGAELRAAIASQAYCGLPAVIVVCDPTLRNQQANGSSLVARLLAREHETDPTLLRVIEFKPETPRNLARGLVNFEPVSVVNPALSSILNAVFAPLKVVLATIGSLGPTLVFIVASVAAVCRLLGFTVRLDDWIVAHGLGGPCAMLAAFLLGFTVRLGFASRFELRTRNAPHVLWIHVWTALALLWLELILFPRAGPLPMFIASVLAGVGFLSACDLVSTSLPGSRNSPV